MLTCIINSILSKAKVELKCLWKKIALLMHQKVETINLIDPTQVRNGISYIYIHMYNCLLLSLFHSWAPCFSNLSFKNLSNVKMENFITIMEIRVF